MNLKGGAGGHFILAAGPRSCFPSLALDFGSPLSEELLDRTAYATKLATIVADMRDGITNGIAELQAIDSGDPSRTDALGHLAWALAHAGRHEEAIETYREMIARDPGIPEIRWRLADRFVNLGELDEAEAAYKVALEHDPQSTDAKMGVRYVGYLRTKPNREPRWVYRPKESTAEKLANRKQNEEDFKRGVLTVPSMPHQLYLESTTKCNFFCKTCTKGYGAYRADDLSDGVFDRFEREVLPFIDRISITGFGEPTLAADFNKILDTSLNAGAFVHFVTNASLLNYERIERLTRYPVQITVSFDGATKETFQEVRAGANFDLIMEKLAMVKKLRDIHLTTVVSQFSFNFVALRKNIRELPDVVRIAHRLGIGSVHVADYSLNNNEFDSESLRNDADLANQSLDEARRVAKELGVNLTTPPPYASIADRARRRRRLFPKANRFAQRCNSPWVEPYIHVDGHVAPCCASKQIMGTIANKPFTHVWNNWKYRILRLRIDSFFPHPECRRCFLSWGINGANPANVMADEGLIVEAMYRIEEWLKEKFWKLRALARKWKSRGKPVIPEPAPNYERGRPIAKAAPRSAEPAQ